MMRPTGQIKAQGSSGIPVVVLGISHRIAQRAKRKVSWGISVAKPKEPAQGSLRIAVKSGIIRWQILKNQAQVITFEWPKAVFVW
jgi:hypothetical protein